MHDSSPAAGCVSGRVAIILRLEAALVLALSIFFYREVQASWILFVVLLLAPDLGMCGYFAGTRTGAWTYNALHSYVGPILLLAAGIYQHATLPFAIIWGAHIALDRMLGYGLKYEDSFQHTHLGLIGKR